MRVREPRWARYIDAAVGEGKPEPPARRGEWLRHRSADLRRRLEQAHTAQAQTQDYRRPDVRLLPAVVAAWGTAALATTLPGRGLALSVLIVLPAGLGMLGFAMLWRSMLRTRRTRSRKKSPARRVPTGGTLLLAALCSAGVLAVVGLQMQTSIMSPLGEAVMQGQEVLVALEIADSPRALEAGNGPERIMFNAVITQSTANGKIATGRLPVRVLAGAEWANVRQGQVVGAAGKVQSNPGQGSETDSRQAFFRPSTGPMPAPATPLGSKASAAPPAPAAPAAASAPGLPTAAAARAAPKGVTPESGSQGHAPAPLVASLREAWKSTVKATWETRSPDTAALLPGMVMGDRAALDEGLNESMKVVGLTHLTAVSGANCTLVIASLMLFLRTLRTPRTVAFAVSLAGLAGFVALVGPDPSVLRAAVMGGIGAMALLSGRPKRVGALLSGSIVVLLLTDPWLASDYAFILSVLATLGLHLVGQRCVRWLSVLFPLWLAQAIAIPLAAQLFCAPVIVLLQARLTPYTIVANMAVAPVVALVTTAGTLGLVCALPFPALAVVCAALSGTGAWWVAVMARWMSSLPASSLPWPEGAVGVVLMAVLNTSLLLGLVAVVDRQRTMAVVRVGLGFVPTWWRQRFGFATLVALAAAVAFFWTAAVVNG